MSRENSSTIAPPRRQVSREIETCRNCLLQMNADAVLLAERARPTVESSREVAE